MKKRMCTLYVSFHCGMNEKNGCVHCIVGLAKRKTSTVNSYNLISISWKI